MILKKVSLRSKREGAAAVPESRTSSVRTGANLSKNNIQSCVGIKADAGVGRCEKCQAKKMDVVRKFSLIIFF